MGFSGAVSDWGKEMWVGKLLGEGQLSPAGVGHHTKPAVTLPAPPWAQESHGEVAGTSLTHATSGESGSV